MMFWTKPEDVKQLKESRNAKFNGSTDHQMFSHIGFFISCYAIAELRLTILLARATGIDKLKSFDLLTYGMDVRTKLERFRQACENGPTIGPNLNSRLEVLNRIMRPLRNKIVHGNSIPNDECSKIHFASLSAMPDFIKPRHPEQDISKNIDSLELFEYCVWLRLFNHDLRGAHRGANRLGMFEIENPTAPLPLGFGQTPEPKATSSKPTRRERKRMRKGQQPRGTYRPK